MSAQGEIAGHPPHPRHSRLSRWGAAFSLAHICLVRGWYFVLFPRPHGYFNQAPVNLPVLAGLLLNFAWITILFRFAIFAIRGSRKIWVHRVGVFALFALMVGPINFVRVYYLDASGTTFLHWLRHPAVIASAGVALALLWRWYAVAAAAMRGFLLILLPLGLWNFFHLAQMTVAEILSPKAQEKVELAPLLDAGGGPPRVVWILFDEMDYRLSFEDRPSDVDLHNFDQLRRESLFATRAIEPGGETLVSMPTLISGEHVAAAETISSRELSITFVGAKTPILWTSTTQVFAQAHAMGRNCAVVGWYNPYGRMFGKDLAYCNDYALPFYEMTRGRTLGEAMLNQLVSAFGPIQHRRRTLQLYREQLASAISVATNNVYALSMLHLFGPHEPGIYNRFTKRFTVTDISTVGAYFNNLALTDVTLGKMREAMESAGAWDRSWVIISSDHHWRHVKSYDGKLDRRVPFIIKAPGAPAGLEMNFPFDTVFTKDLILAILRGEVSDAPAALDWCRQLSPPPPIMTPMDEAAIEQSQATEG